MYVGSLLWVLIRMALVYSLPTTGRKIPLSCSRRVLANSFIVFLAPRKFITADFENAIAINCACLPTYGPILSRSGAAFSRIKARYHARRGELAWRVDSDHDTLAQDHEPIRDLYSRHENRNSLEKVHNVNLAKEPSTRNSVKTRESCILDTIQGTKVIEVV